MITNRAFQAYQLLSSWKKIPGVKDDLSIDEQFLKNWVKEARSLAVQENRVKVVDMHIGQILAQYPERDSNWPPDEICGIIEDINTDSLKNNFSAAIYNNRGSYSKSPFDGGARERAIAKHFNTLATQLINKFPNVAALLTRLAKGYEQDAIEEDERAERDRLEY
jgi:hypothetical protein